MATESECLTAYVF